MYIYIIPVFIFRKHNDLFMFKELTINEIQSLNWNQKLGHHFWRQQWKIFT